MKRHEHGKAAGDGRAGFWLRRLLAPPETTVARAPGRPVRWLHHASALGAFGLLTLAMFAGVLFAPEPLVLSNRQTDVFHQFLPWREFGFGELRRGNLALWNPHLFCGAPFFGGFQSALLYPPNWLHLLLPVATAINVGIALHVFLAGAFTYAWAVGRGLHPLAAFLSGTCFMFGGAYFPHIFAGHLPNLCAMVWAPLVFLALDRWFEGFARSALLMGMFAVAMQVFAGHPQYVFYTAVGAALYTALHLVRGQRRLHRLVGPAVIYAGGALLSAVQLLTGLVESRETLRSGGVPFEFAAMFSFPPENVLTLVAPWFFGGLKGTPAYWGRCYLWEMTLFFSITGLALAGYGAVAGERRQRRFAAAMVLAAMVLALGAHTPLFKVLYGGVPGFDRVRRNSKYNILAALYQSLLAGAGL
ncbi:MAG: hypothetical protein RMK20_10435, partial [Verrucomicrobiales bacterium]|nr:hypothetical protein [Verrucomicrobiales bacterium]